MYRVTKMVTNRCPKVVHMDQNGPIGGGLYWRCPKWSLWTESGDLKKSCKNNGGAVELAQYMPTFGPSVPQHGYTTFHPHSFYSFLTVSYYASYAPDGLPYVPYDLIWHTYVFAASYAVLLPYLSYDNPHAPYEKYDNEVGIVEGFWERGKVGGVARKCSHENVVDVHNGLGYGVLH